MPTRTVLLALLSVVLAALLGGCMGDVALTPESAVHNIVAKDAVSADIKVDPNSVQVLQSQALGDNYLVLVNFQGTHVKAGSQNCLYSYLATKAPLGGWVTGGGGGSCAQPPADPAAVPISITGGSGKGGQNDPGYSSIGGQIWLRFVKIVKVTWNDGKVEQLAVNNNSYLSARTGQFTYTKVEVIDDQNKIIYTFIPAAK